MKKYRTKYPGVRYVKHATRKHGIQLDKYFSIRYQIDGHRREEGLGWLTEKMTAEKAAGILADLKEAKRTGSGDPTTLKDRRERLKVEKENRVKEAITFKDFFEKTYYPIAERSKKRESYLKEMGHFKNWIEQAIGEIPLKDLRPIHLERIKRALLEAKKSPRTIEYVFSTIRGVWNQARKHRIIEGDSPTKAVKKPKVENKRIRYLTADEAYTLLEDLKRRDLATWRMAFISLFMGLRAGEIFNLKWKSLDRESGLLWIMDSKSGKSRAVYMPDQVKGLFEEMTTGEPESLIFPNPNGKQFKEIPSYFKTSVKKLKFNEGIIDRRERFSFHSLRHTAASFLIQSGVDLYTVKEILGHGSIALTERYSHIADHALKEAAQKMPDLTKEPQHGKVIELKK